MPTKMAGTAAGKMTLRSSWRVREAERARDLDVVTRGTLRMPLSVLMATGTRLACAMITTLSDSPMPEHHHRERQPAQHRHLTDRLKQRTEVVLDAARQPHRDAEHDAAQGAEREARRDAPQADREVGEQLARVVLLPQRVGDQRSAPAGSAAAPTRDRPPPSTTRARRSGTTSRRTAEPSELASLDSGVLTAGLLDAAEASGARS